MAITLAEAKVGMSNKVDQTVIDEFQRSSLLMDMMTFDDAISPGTGGSTLTYGYIQLDAPSTAAVRSINNEFSANEAKRIEKTAKAIIMGGAFEVDRVIQATSGAVDEIAFQLSDKIKATTNQYHNLIINGSSKATADTGYVHGTFDGLRKSMAAKQTFQSVTSIATASDMDSNYAAFLDELEEMIAAVEGGADILLMNKKALAKLRAIARRAGYFGSDRDEFGRIVERYNDIPMMDAGIFYNGSTTVDVVETDSTNKTTIYAVKLGIDAFHGISPMGGASGLIHTYLPDLNAPGAVKRGEVELVAGAVLKNKLKAAMLTDIAVK